MKFEKHEFKKKSIKVKKKLYNRRFVAILSTILYSCYGKKIVCID
jgi:hypothetical protein